MQFTVLLFYTRYRIVPGIVLTLVWYICTAQKSTDSLVNVLNKQRKEDTVRLNTLNKISIALSDENSGRGIFYADTAIALAKKIGNRPKLAEAYLNLSKNYSFKNDLTNARRFATAASTIYSGLKDPENLAVCYQEIARMEYALANYVQALNYAKKALSEAQKTSNRLLIASCLNTVGFSYGCLADYPQAVAYHFKQLKIYEDLHNEPGIGKAYGNIGLIYYYLKKYPEAIKYTTRCLHALEKAGDKVYVAAALSNIGAFYLETGNYEQTIAHNKKALLINKFNNNKKGIANDLTDMGVAYYKLKRYRQSVAYLNQAISLYDTLGAKNNLSIAMGHLAEVYTVNKAGLTDYKKSLQLQLQSVELARQTKDLNNEANQWKRLSTIYELRKNYKPALESFHTYIKLRDSIINDKKKQEISQLTMRYEFEKKETALTLANNKKHALTMMEVSRQKFIRNASISIGVILMLAAAVTFMFYKRRKEAEKQQNEAELRAQVADTEMKALRLQINPHFIFNALNSISYYISRSDKESADTFLSKFARLMRMTLENSELSEISIADDIQTLELYMQIEALRLDNKFCYQFRIDEKIDTENLMVPPMMLQPFVENSIWHGLSSKNADGRITVDIKHNLNMLVCTVEDNGIGRQNAGKNKNGSTHNKSFGLKVVQARIDVINRTRQSNAKIEMVDLAQGTKAIITLPYQELF